MAKPAQQNQQSEWLPMPEGMWRFVIGKPIIQERVSQWGTWPELTFPLTLTEAEQERLISLHGEPAQGQQQSYRLWIRGKEATACGYYKAGAYQQTDCGLAQLMCAAVGAANARRLREWMSAGGVPPLSPNQTEDEEWAELISWYSWFENLEVYATVRHDPDKKIPGKVWPRCAAILPVGSLPNQPETEYQQACAGKVRTMINLAGGVVPPAPPPQAAPVAPGVDSETETDEEAVLAAQLEAARARKAAANQAKVAETTTAATARTYEALFAEGALPA